MALGSELEDLTLAIGKQFVGPDRRRIFSLRARPYELSEFRAEIAAPGDHHSDRPRELGGLFVLHNIARGTIPECPQYIRDASVPGNNEHRRLFRDLAYPLCHVQTIQPGHRDTADQEPRLDADDKTNGLKPVGRFADDLQVCLTRQEAP